METKKILLILHGESISNKKRVITDRTDEFDVIKLTNFTPSCGQAGVLIKYFFAFLVKKSGSRY